MSDTYCPLCDGDPRRRANVEPHKAHTVEIRTEAEIKTGISPADVCPAYAPGDPRRHGAQPTLPGDLEKEWYDT